MGIKSEMEQKLELGAGQTLTLVTRQGWGAMPSESAEPLILPATYVRFLYTGKAFCRTPPECAARLRDLQQNFKNKGLVDLPYNFLVGGDGQVYEGVGWRIDGENNQTVMPKYNPLKGKVFNIAYLGNFSEEDPSYDMLSTAMDFLKYALKEKLVDPLYRLGPDDKLGH